MDSQQERAAGASSAATTFNATSSLSGSWKEPLNKSDSLGLLSILLGTWFVIIAPPLWEKIPALLMLSGGVVYLIWLSHWTNLWKKNAKRLVSAVAILLLVIPAIPQFYKEWRFEHLRAEIQLKGYASNLSYPDGDHAGIKWNKDFSETRIEFTAPTYPLQNLNLSIGVADKSDAITGLSSGEDSGCAAIKPRLNLVPSAIFRGADDSGADLAPDLNDVWNAAHGGLFDARDHYDLHCPRIEAGQTLTLTIGTSQREAPATMRIKGQYETTPAEGNKRIPVEETIAITRPPRWK